ncbi:uncharacterized protein LOC134227622 [Armigeres subalbatus]|uniref:uncharacterized protein LOC134227622 n=1 Tax=Armigeres subalbatus TaxID=124917 RepID=UPI002ED596AA
MVACPSVRHVPYSAEQAADRRQSAIHHRKNMLLLVSVLCLTTWLTAVSCGKVSWPALEQKDEYFQPLMQSFSKFPFHDIYETAPHPSDLMLPGARLNKMKPMREWSRKTAKESGNVKSDGSTQCRLCDLLSSIMDGTNEQRRNASKKRVRPVKMRKLMKYCRKN